MARYAEGTTVPVEQSQAEIRGLLARHGVTAYGTAEGTGKDGTYRSAIQFVLNGLPYRFDVEKPDPELYRAEYERTRQRGQPYAHSIDFNARATREWKRRWRARLLWLKATLEFASGEGDAEVERALLSYLVLPDSRTTMFEHAQRELPHAYAEGRMPALMLTGGD
jgi:hypothetical protein